MTGVTVATARLAMTWKGTLVSSGFEAVVGKVAPANSTMVSMKNYWMALIPQIIRRSNKVVLLLRRLGAIKYVAFKVIHLLLQRHP